MIELDKIINAFAWRKMPNPPAMDFNAITSEQKDASWFEWRNWREISRKDWEEHRDAIFAFTPEQFAYYLPSILKINLEDPEEWFWPASHVLEVLDRSPVVDYWDDFFKSRFLGLKKEEYVALKEWLLCLRDGQGVAADNSIDRAFDTISLLEQKIELA